MRSRADLYEWELAHVAGRTHQDLGFYSALAHRSHGPVLELGCGTGRLTVPLGAVGIDNDPVMLAAARRRGARRLVCADMRSFALAGRFAVVAIPYNGLQLLVDDDDVLACLRSAASHLGAGGALALEVTDFQAGAVTTSAGPELLGSADGVTLHGAVVHDLSRRVTTYHRRFQEDGRARVDHVHLRCLRREELELLLLAAGLQLHDVAGTPPRLLCTAGAAVRPGTRPAPRGRRGPR